jgi:hypothetical protein
MERSGPGVETSLDEIASRCPADPIGVDGELAPRGGLARGAFPAHWSRATVIISLRLVRLDLLAWWACADSMMSSVGTS